MPVTSQAGTAANSKVSKIQAENVCNPAGELIISSLVTDTVAEQGSGHRRCQQSTMKLNEAPPAG